jgi:dihydroxyacetone kinase
MVKSPEEQIKELQAQIKALKAAAKAEQKGTTVRAKRKTGVTMLTSSIRSARDAAASEEYLRKIRKLVAQSGLGGAELSRSQIVDAYAGCLADLPALT